MFPGDEVIEPTTREREKSSEWLIKRLKAVLGMNN
jgi:hypothetical protein